MELNLFSDDFFTTVPTQFYSANYFDEGGLTGKSICLMFDKRDAPVKGDLVELDDSDELVVIGNRISLTIVAEQFGGEVSKGKKYGMTIEEYLSEVLSESIRALPELFKS